MKVTITGEMSIEELCVLIDKARACGKEDAKEWAESHKMPDPPPTTSPRPASDSEVKDWQGKKVSFINKSDAPPKLNSTMGLLVNEDYGVTIELVSCRGERFPKSLFLLHP